MSMTWLNKCAISTLDKGGAASRRLWSVQDIPYLDRDVTYKYLGVKQHFGHGDSQCTKEALEKELNSLTLKIIMGGLDSKTTARIYNGLVAGKARYYLATGIWTKDQAQVKLERALRKKLSQSGFHYRSAAIERLYIPRPLREPWFNKYRPHI